MKSIITIIFLLATFSVNAEIAFLTGAEKTNFEVKVKGFLTDYRDDLYEINFTRIDEDFFIYEINDAFIFSGTYLGSVKSQKTVKITGGFPKTIGYLPSVNDIKIITGNAVMRRGIANEYIDVSTCDKSSLSCETENVLAVSWDAATGNCGRGLERATEIKSTEINKNMLRIVTEEYNCTANKSKNNIREIAM